MKQTAVEWQHADFIRINFEYATSKITPRDFQEQIKKNLEQAKEMEKQQQDEFAIEFTEWCNDNYFRMGNTNIWLESKDFEIPIKYTTKELLEIFKTRLQG
jgi:hypothetical protein